MLNAIFVGIGVSLSEVRSSDKLADNHKVKTRIGYFLFERAGRGKRSKQLCGTDICKQLQCASDTQKTRFWTEVSGESVPLWTAHRAKKNAVRFKTYVNSFLRQRHTRCVDSTAAHKNVRKIKCVTEPFAHLVHDFNSLVHYLRTDSVALDNCNIFIHSIIPFIVSFVV